MKAKTTLIHKFYFLTFLILLLTPNLKAFAQIQFVETPAPPAPGFFDGSEGQSLAFADVDGDNDQDVLVIGLNESGQQIADLFTNDGSGNYTETVSVGALFQGVEEGSLAFADIDGDSDQDVLITGFCTLCGQIISTFYTNDGNGNFAQSMTASTEPVQNSSIAFADIDGDNDQDLLITGRDNFFQPIAELYTNDGNGNFTEVIGTPFEGVEDSSIAFADVDGDSDQDVLITGFTNSFQAISKLYTNDGNGNYTEMAGTPFDAVTFGSIAFADIDGDSDRDVLITGSGSGFQYISKLYTNDGSGGYTLVSGTPFEGVSFGSIAFGDIDGDSDQDVLITGSNNNFTLTSKLYTNDGSGGYTLVSGTPFEGVSNGSVALADIDGDGDQDVLINGTNVIGTRLAKLFKNNTPLPCLAPSNLSSDNLTATTADLSWATSTSETDGYDYVLITDSSIPDATTTPTGSVNTGIASVNLFGLTPETTYEAYVRSNCGSGNLSDWSAVVGFSTLSNPTNALDFDGANDFVEASSTGLPTGSAARTVEFWFNPQTTQSTTFIMGYSNEAGGNGTAFGIFCRNIGGQIGLRFWGHNLDFNITTTPLNYNEWQHAAIVYDGTEMKCYINGILETTTTVSINTSGNTPLFIGKSAASFSGNFDGQLDEFRIWNTARTFSEINANKDNELVGNESGLIAYYNFNQGISGGDNMGLTTLNDLTSNNNGTLNNFALTGLASNWVGACANGLNGTTPTPQPEINLQGNGTSIADGDATPSITDNTDFGNIVNGTPNTVTYTIQNTETGSSLTVADIVVSGANAGDFVVSDFTNNTTVAGNTTTTFDLTFTPSALETRTAIITINNNDCDEAEYDFAVQGAGIGSNNALDFDAGDYVRIPHNNALNVDETHTVEFWLKVNSNLGTFISRKENGGVGIDMFGNNAMQHVTWGDDALYSGALQTDGNWHHYAFVARGSGDRELFVDGISFGTNTTPYSMNTGTNDMYLGFTNNTGIMTLDEYRLWDVARTQTEINNNMNTELTGVEAGLIAYYTFDEGTAGANNTGITAPEIIDQAGCNNGIMNNFAKNGTTSNWVNSSSTITEVSQVIKGDINLQGNGSSIANGDATPSTTDDTDFGSSDFGVTGQTVTYTIQNTVAGSQLSVASIEINGAGTAEFSIANFVPNTVINGVNSSTFDVTFTPNAIGPRNATITINNNDCDDASYNFAIQGTGTGTAPANALDFDGTDDHIDISHFERPDTMTIEAWIKSDLATSGGAIVGWAGNTNNFAELLNVGNNVRYCEWDGANYLCSENVDVSDGNWHHIAVVRNGNTTNNLSIYKDGFLIGTNTVNSTITTNDLKIGAIDWFGNLFRIFMGQIDEVRIWNTARTCSEINANKDNELVGDETGLIAYYNFNQGIAGEDNTGLTALDDLKSNNNDGTLTNFALTGVASNWVDASANGVGGTTPGAAPEINVQGNGTSIADGDATPSITDDTDFANIVNGTPNTVTYTIQNTEAGSSLTVADIVVSGANAGDFVVSDFINNTTVAGNATTTFDLTFTPSALGNRTAIITINNNDCDEGLYDFAVRGTSVEPCITPTNLSVSNITTTTADLSWDAGVNESNGYDYVLITDGSTPDGTTTATGSVPTGEVTQTLTGLTLGTTYDVYVRSDCTVNVSDWSVVESFTTLCFGTDYTGNANTGFGDVVGNSSLNFTDDGTTITGTFTKGSGDFNDAMVMYISTGETGRAVIDINVNDEGDPLRRAISSAGTDGSVITFPSGFQATHAIAINVGFGGLWSIPATGTVGNNGLPFIEEVGSPAINTEASFSFSFNWSDVGLTSQDDFSFVVTYLNSSNGSTSNEAYSDGITGGNPGTTDFSFTNARNYPFYYVFDGTSWSPTNPDSVNENCRSAILRSGTAVFSSSTTLKEIKVNPQAVLDLDADLNADVLFKGDANGSAQLADATGITLSGNVTVERFIPAGNRAFRFLASPVTSTGSINDNWQEGATTANINPNPGFGAHITGVSGTVGNVNANGLDETQTGNPSMFTFNNTNTGNQNNAWSSVTNTNTNILEAGDPYLLLLRGDRSIDLSINNPNSTATTLRATGELFTGSHSPLLSEVEDYYSFVANPYQAVVNMNNVSTSNVNPNFFWYWDPNLNSSTFGGYINVNILTGVSNVLSAANQFLQPGQAIFVQTLSSGPASITFDENDKAVNSIQTGVFNEPLSSIKMLLYRTQALNDGERETDGVVINFEDNANNAIDALDGNKFFNSGENIARSQNNKYVSIENRAIPQNNEVLDIFTNNLNSSTYSFVVNANGIQDNFDVFLMDGYLGTTAQLTEGLYQYDFIADTNIPESIASDRFSLVFENTTLSLDDNNLGVDFSLYPNPTQDGQFTIQSQAISSDDFEIKIHNILGQEVFHEAYKNNANGSINIDASGLSSGVYIVEFYQNAKTLVTKLIVE